MKSVQSFLSARFILLNACYFALCSSLASFFSLQSYVAGLGVDGVLNGLILGSVGLGALFARPLIAPRLGTLKSCCAFLLGSTALLLLALACYPFVDGFYSLLAIRLFNGVGFAGLFCSLVALSPYAFDAERSGHAFSIISMVCLLPFIIVPPLLSPAEKLFGFGLTVFLAGLPMAFFAPLATIAFRKHGDALGSEASVPLPLRRCLIGLKRPWLLALLFATATFYYTYAWVFYNAFGLSTKAGIANPGDLLSLASLCTILFRVIVGRRLDGAWRPALLAGALILNALAAFLLAACSLPKWGYYVDFALFGLAWGAAVPLLLSAVMERSPKDEQGFNLNASSQMQDAGYFLGPMLGGFFASEYLLALLGALTVMAVLGGWRARDKV